MIQTQTTVATEAIIRPSAENVLPLKQYINTQPRIIGDNPELMIDDDYIILFGGGRDFQLSVWGYKDNSNEEQTIDNVELFILNKCIIIWFKDMNKGIELSYNGVIYHGCNRLTGNEVRDGHRLELLITVIRDAFISELFPKPPILQPQDTEELFLENEFTMESIEFKLKPKHSTFDRYYTDEVEKLFTFQNFGSNRGDDMVINCNEALAKCLELNGNEFNDTETDTEDIQLQDDEHQQEQPSIPMAFNDIINSYNNTGNADDLDNTYVSANQHETDTDDAAMSMHFYANQSTRQKRSQP